MNERKVAALTCRATSYTGRVYFDLHTKDSASNAMLAMPNGCLFDIKT